MTKRKMKKVLYPIVALVVLAAGALGFINQDKVRAIFGLTGRGEVEQVTLVRCVDGDTANFSTSYGNVNVRFSGVNTPETKHPQKGEEPYGQEASAFTQEKLENAEIIEIEWDKTQEWSYGRPIGVIWIDDENLNLMLVEEGLAELSYLKESMPYAQDYWRAEDRAKLYKRGMWSDDTSNSYSLGVAIFFLKYIVL